MPATDQREQIQAAFATVERAARHFSLKLIKPTNQGLKRIDSLM